MSDAPDSPPPPASPPRRKRRDEIKAELLAEMARPEVEPHRYVSLEAARVIFENPEEAGDLLDVLDRDGWVMDVQREHRLEMPAGVRLLVPAGLPIADALDQLDRLRRELQARPETINPDWSQPLPQDRPKRALRVVKGGK